MFDYLYDYLFGEMKKVYKKFIIKSKGGHFMIKQRNIALCIVFSIITFGIYALYWFVCLTNDANQESGQTDATSGGVALLLTIVTCNIYGWFWAYKMGEKIDAIKTKNGQPAGNSSILFLLLQLCGLGIVSYAIMQDTINKNA